MSPYLAVSILLALTMAGHSLAQVPPLPGEERMEAAMESGEKALTRKDWAAAADRFAEARAALPDALPPLLGMARAREGQARPLEAAVWYRGFLAASLDPDEDQRQSLCRRITALQAAHRKRTDTALAMADKIVKAADAAVEKAPPPEGGTRAAERARLLPARAGLDQALRGASAPAPQPQDFQSLNQGIGVTEAWLALAENGQWAEMEAAYKGLSNREAKPIDRALAASGHARLHVTLGKEAEALARITDDVGRGCQSRR